MLKGIIFDLDGILTDTVDFHFRAWQEISSELNIKIDETFNEKLKGVSRLDSLNLILEKGNKKEKYTADEKKVITEKKNQIYINLIQQLKPNDILPGMKELLEDIKTNNIKMAIASASKNAPYILKKLEIDAYFDAIVNPEKLKKGKPDPQIFSTAVKLLQLKNNEVVGIEDSSAGIESINRAGIYSIAVGDNNDLSNANIVIKSTQELTLDLIKKNLKQEEKVIDF